MESHNKPQPVYGVGLATHESAIYIEQAGINLTNISFQQLVELCDTQVLPNVVLSEGSVKNHHEHILRLMDDKKIQEITIHNDHPFGIDNNILDKLNTYGKTYKINIVINGYFAKNYENINIFYLEQSEFAIGHHFNKLLSKILHTRRKPNKTFIMQSVFKDEFRSSVGQHLRNSDVWPDFADTKMDNTSQSLYSHSDKFLKKLEQEFGKGSNVQAFIGFGNGLPNLKLYENAFCEIVMETSHNGPWHFSEKTFRPIAFGIPVVHLGHRTSHERLMHYGYKFYDNGFYERWHSDIPQQQKLSHLIEFLKHIKNDGIEGMEKIAKHNYNIFWNQRRSAYYELLQKLFDTVFGQQTLAHKVYKLLDS